MSKLLEYEAKIIALSHWSSNVGGLPTKYYRIGITMQVKDGPTFQVLDTNATEEQFNKLQEVYDNNKVLTIRIGVNE